jgi:putative drug exporter of the RND superfamily
MSRRAPDKSTEIAPETAAPHGERLTAHQRPSTGLLARWARACTTHPWRVVGAWVGIFAVLAVLVVTIGGSLRDQFTIPGSDSQRGTDLIESQFKSEQGSVLNIVFAVPAGERLDTPQRRAAIEKVIASLRTAKFKPTAGRAGIESVNDPFLGGRFAKDGRIAYSEAQFDRVIYSKDRDAVVAVENAVRKDVAPADVTVEYNGEAEFAPIQQGTQELLGILAALIVLLVVFRTFTAMFIPIALAITALLAAFLLLFTLAGLTDFNTITPLLVSMIGLGVGIDYSLFIVTRFRQLLHEGLSPRDAAAEASASAGRAVLFAGVTVAISVTGLAFFGLDFVTKLGIGSALGVLTTVLIASSLLPAVLAKLGHRVDRLKVPFLRAVNESEAARQQTLVARWGRFVAGNARFVFPIVAVVVVGLGSTSMLVRLGASWRKASAPASTGQFRSSWTSRATGRLRSASTSALGALPTLLPSRGRSSTTRGPSRSSSSPRTRRRRTRRPTSSSTGCATTSSLPPRRAVTPLPTSPARRPRSRTSPIES